MADGWILALNAGSSSLKFAAYDLSATTKLAAGQINGTPSLDAALTQLGMDGPPKIIGHRIVHGGARSTSAQLTPQLRQEIQDVAVLAPLHNPPALAVIDAVSARFPTLPQVACFDTAFHATNPEVATVIPLPQQFRDQGIRRYGFHGLSYASLVRRFSAETGQPLPRRLLALHLGAGASLAAIVDGKSIATTMGFSPMDGLVMASRAGAMDAGVVLHMAGQLGMSADAISDVLNKQSGLTGLAGSGDMKTLLETNSAAARFAVEHYCYWVARHAGSMIAAMQGVDGFVFTGGIGENAKPVRTSIMSKLDWLGPSAQNVWVIPADEEAEISHSAAQVLG
ncbi:MAG: acetate kinase [Rhodobacteraceae bacterium]|nr:acetate kinase [Paracoccaceae bacterium]